MNGLYYLDNMNQWIRIKEKNHLDLFENKSDARFKVKLTERNQGGGAGKIPAQKMEKPFHFIFPPSFSRNFNKVLSQTRKYDW